MALVNGVTRAVWADKVSAERMSEPKKCVETSLISTKMTKFLLSVLASASIVAAQLTARCRLGANGEFARHAVDVTAGSRTHRTRQLSVRPRLHHAPASHASLFCSPVALCSLGPNVSCISLGTLHLNENGRTPAQALDILQTAVANGVTTIDTSDVYGGGQAVTLLGQAFALSPGFRAKVEIIAKVGDGVLRCGVRVGRAVRVGCARARACVWCTRRRVPLWITVKVYVLWSDAGGLVGVGQTRGGARSASLSNVAAPLAECELPAARPSPPSPADGHHGCPAWVQVRQWPALGKAAGVRPSQ